MSVAEVNDETVAEVVNVADVKDKKTRNLFFTLNNYTEDDYNEIKEWIDKLAAEDKYGIVCKETAPTTGTPHLHGYLEFKNDMRWGTLKNILPRANLQKRKGKPHQVIAYCKKDGTYYENGTPSKQGQRTDIDDAADLIKQGKSIKEVANEYPSTYIKFHKGLERLKALQYTNRTERPKVFWYWGTSGTGKTYTAVKAHKTHYIKDSSIWWDNYEQQEAIIIDDFDGKWNYRDFLRLLDENAYQGQMKGSYIPINSPYVYITCEFEPSHFWEGNELDQVVSRLHIIKKFEGANQRSGPSQNCVAEVAGNTIPPPATNANMTCLESLDWNIIFKK